MSRYCPTSVSTGIRFGRRFELLFLQVVDYLVRPEPFNLSLPSTFVATARRYRGKDAETVRHFQYD